MRNCSWFRKFSFKKKNQSGLGFISASGTYISPYNILNFPAGIVRMTSVTEEDDNMMTSYPDHDMGHKRVIEVMTPVSLFQLMPWMNLHSQNDKVPFVDPRLPRKFWGKKPKATSKMILTRHQWFTKFEHWIVACLANIIFVNFRLWKAPLDFQWEYRL